MAAQTGYVLIDKQLVDPDSLQDTNRAERGLAAEQWKGSKVIAQMPDLPNDKNRNLITYDQNNDAKTDVGLQIQEDDPSSENSCGLSAGNLNDSSAVASLSQDDSLKARIAAWQSSDRKSVV